MGPHELNYFFYIYNFFVHEKIVNKKIKRRMDTSPTKIELP